MSIVIGPTLLAFPADYYEILLPAGMTTQQQLVGYSFQSASINTVLDEGLDDGMSAYLWDVPNQTWVITSYVDGFGWFPNYTVETGTSFFIEYSRSYRSWLKVKGTSVSTNGFTMTLEPNKMYMLASAYKLLLSYQGNPYRDQHFLECVDPSPYVHFSLNYRANQGDTAYTWSFAGQQWSSPQVRTNENNEPKWLNSPTDCSPSVIVDPPWDASENDDSHRLPVYGGGFALVPSATNIWIHLNQSDDHLCPRP